MIGENTNIGRREFPTSCAFLFRAKLARQQRRKVFLSQRQKGLKVSQTPNNIPQTPNAKQFSN
jgi:hypothetical protein